LLNTWTSVNTFTYFKLASGATPESLKDRIWHWVDNESPFLEMMEGEGKPTDRIQPNVMAVPDIYLHARQDAGNGGDFRALGDINMVYAFSGIAILILIVASINFMNLSTARASQRAREVALRKVLGATRAQVAMQFLGEAITVTMIALLFALVAVEMVLPLYNETIGRELIFSLATELPLLLGLVAISLLVGLVSGSYPAIYLSRFLPARILKANQSSDEVGSQHVRGVLVVFQFAVSIALGICTAVVYAQTLYARSMDVGYSVEQKLVIHGLSASAIRDQKQVIVDQLARIPGVSNVVLSSEVPSQDNENNTGFQLLDGVGGGVAGDDIILNYYNAGFDFFESYGMDIIAGRSFSREFSTDEIKAIPEEDDRIGLANIIINESAARQLGFSSPEQAIGKVLRSEVFRAGNHDLTIVGVARDVYFRSLKFGIRASVFMNFPGNLNEATVTYNTNDVASLLAEIERTWKEIVPLTPISHEFLSDMVSAQYQEEEQQAQLFAAFSILAVVIACLGLYGLASFTAERRTREIGIRKVLGAKVKDIVQLLVWQFSRPVLLANFIAWPVAWYLVSGWLEGFEYRIGAGDILIVCAIAGTASLLIAWSTVASRAIKVARANPIKALRYE
jgi:putative ABC transport system permease protein